MKTPALELAEAGDKDPEYALRVNPGFSGWKTLSERKPAVVTQICRASGCRGQRVCQQPAHIRSPETLAVLW